MGVIEQLAQQNAQMRAAFEKQEADRLLAAQQQAKAEERALQRNRTNLALQMVGMMGGDDSDNSYYDMWKPLINMGAYGGHLYDGWTEPTGLMNRKRLDDIQNLNNDILDFEKNASSNNEFSTITDAETGEVGQIMGITPDGTYRTVYPSGTYNMTLDLPNTDVLGSKARMKAARGLEAPLLGGELKDNQYRTMPTNSEANAFADAWTEQTAPTVGHLISAGLKPLDLITPSRYVGLLDSDNKNGFLHLFDEDNRGFFIGNDPTKPFNKHFHDEHPILAGIGNTALDIPAGMAAGWAIGKGYNAAAPYVENAYNTGKNVATTFEEIMPEIGNWAADKMHFPELKGFVNKNGQYYEARFNPFQNKTLQEKILEDGYSPNLRRGEPRLIENGGIPRYYYNKIDSNTGVKETVGINPYAGGRIFEYNVTSSTPDGMDLGISSIKRSSYGYKSPGPYKMGNQFDLALTAGTVPTVDKNVLKSFGAGIQRFAPKGARITGDGAPSIADRVLNNLESKHYWDALKLAARRPMLPTNNALSTDSYRYLVGYGTKYPKFSTFYDGYDTSFNNAGVKYVDDINLLKTSPETLNDIYLGLDENYPEIINDRLPHPWIKKK